MVFHGIKVVHISFVAIPRFRRFEKKIGLASEQEGESQKQTCGLGEVIEVVWSNPANQRPSKNWVRIKCGGHSREGFLPCFPSKLSNNQRTKPPMMICFWQSGCVLGGGASVKNKSVLFRTRDPERLTSVWFPLSHPKTSGFRLFNYSTAPRGD